MTPYEILTERDGVLMYWAVRSDVSLAQQVNRLRSLDYRILRYRWRGQVAPA